MNTNSQQDALSTRWTLEGRIPLSRVAEGAEWRRARVVDTDESVVLFIVRGQAAAETADAVRRAYLVEDARLLPVREIEAPDDELTVVEYPLPPAPPLAALLSKGALHPETARAIIGEAAAGLEVARRRGVRHQFLDSNRVFVDTASGEVVVLGVGAEAASHPGLDRSREVASFQDTAALAALLYRALTGRSPRRGEGGTVPRPSAVTAQEIPPDLDLLCDAVLNESSDDMPVTTRSLIEELRPWQSIPVTLEAYGSRQETAAQPVAGPTEPAAGAQPAAEAPPEPPAEQGPEAPQEPTAPQEAEAPQAAAPQGPASAPTGPPPAVPAAAAGAATLAGAAAAAAALPGAPDATGSPQEKSTDSTAAPGTVAEHSTDAAPPDQDPAEDTAATAPPTAAATEPDAAPSPAAEGADAAAAAESSRAANALVQELHLTQKRSSSPFPGQMSISPQQPAPAMDPAPATDAEPDATADAGAAPAQTTGTSVATAPTDEPPSATSPEPSPEQPPSATPLAAGGAAAAAAVPSPSATPAASPATPPTEDEDVPTPAAAPEPSGPIVVHGRDRSVLEETAPSAAWAGGRSSLLRDVVGVATDADDPDTFALGPQDQERRSLQSQWIIAGGVILVMLALVLAITTVTRDLPSIIEDPLATSEAPSEEPTADEETGEAPVEPTAEETEKELPAAQLASVELFTPGGDEVDNADQQDRIHDGDPASFWSTKYYATPDYGGLKDGVGVRVHLAEPSELKAVTVTTAKNTGGTLELRAVNDDGSLGDVLTSGSFAGDGEVRLDLPEPLETEQVALWIPELPPDSDQAGNFRARIAEIRIE